MGASRLDRSARHGLPTRSASGLLPPLIRPARKAGTVVIGSHHDFERTPKVSVLKDVVRRGRRAGVDIVKIATFIRRAEDVFVLLELLGEVDGGPLCLIGMGPLGLQTRIRLACDGSCLTYGFVDRPAAPGQWSCGELVARLRESCASFDSDYLARRR